MSFFRCIALNALGVFIVEELIHCQGHPKVHDCICVLLASITVSTGAFCLHIQQKFASPSCLHGVSGKWRLCAVAAPSSISYLVQKSVVNWTKREPGREPSNRPLIIRILSSFSPGGGGEGIFISWVNSTNTCTCISINNQCKVWSKELSQCFLVL